MEITLTPEQEAWLQVRFKAKDRAAVAAAARRIIDERIAQDGEAAPGRREVMKVEWLSDLELADIEASEMSPEHDHLNAELS